MTIVDVVVAEGLGGFFYDDQVAIAGGAPADGFAYFGPARTAGYKQIRIPAGCLSLGLVLDDGFVAWGDMVGVQYSGVAGREPPFQPASAAKLVSTRLGPRLVDLELRNFHAACENVFRQADGSRLPIAVEYGVSQALLRATAHGRQCTMAEVICDELSLPIIPKGVPIYAQSGDARETNIDKMILKRVDVLPHGLINSREKFGAGGVAFLELVKWTVDRIRRLGGRDYIPTLHFDVYGWVGREYDLDVQAMADWLALAAEAAGPLPLQVETPAIYPTRDAQLEGYATLVRRLSELGASTRVVVDEWCNTLTDIEDFAREGAGHMIQIKTPDLGRLDDTIRAVGICKSRGIAAYVGGSCVETDSSAIACVHVAVATQADMLLAKPGMGVDEALSIVGNEQSRLLTMLRRLPPMKRTIQ